jgi:hypothetical protein
MRGNSPYFRLAVVCVFSAVFGLNVFAQSDKQTAGSLGMVAADGRPAGMTGQGRGRGRVQKHRQPN